MAIKDEGLKARFAAFVAAVVDAICRRGAHPFVTDTVRMLGHEYLAVANRNGYNQSALRCPVLLADGIFGNDSIEVDAGPPLGTQSIASAMSAGVTTTVSKFASEATISLASRGSIPSLFVATT